jgi:AraC-like DNA-binding protein
VKNFLRDPAYTIAQISYRLGYAEPRLSPRAFRDWTGRSLKQWRKLNLQGIYLYLFSFMVYFYTQQDERS